jgi:hypothetical protein
VNIFGDRVTDNLYHKGGALIQQNQCPYKRYQGCMHTEKRPCKDIASRWLWRESSGKTKPPDTLIFNFCPRTQHLLFKSFSLWYIVLKPQQSNKLPNQVMPFPLNTKLLDLSSRYNYMVNKHLSVNKAIPTLDLHLFNSNVPSLISFAHSAAQAKYLGVTSASSCQQAS